ncbi:MAG: Uma2 family endonuclease, partial [bacterium]|nr:Uma2 family endonuclease [bacterium]
MGLPARKHTVFTYDDYLSWGDDERWEIIDGEAFKMAAAPLTVHQLIIGELMRQMGNQLKDGPCRVIVAPFDVRLPLRDEREDDIVNVVQPDISVVCD